MPVVKNDWDIYKSNRSRRSSECSNPRSCRSRKVSECRSEGPSLSTSPGSDFIVGSPAHRSVPVNMSSKYSRASSRTSQASFESPCKSASSSPPKTTSESSLNKFHNRLVDKLKRSLRHKSNSGSENNSSWVEECVKGSQKCSQPVKVPKSGSRTDNAQCFQAAPSSC